MSAGIKYTIQGLEARRDALLKGKKVKPKYFKISNESIDLEKDIEDLPSSWIQKDIWGFRAIDNRAIELELRVEKKEATDEGRSFCIYLEDDTPYIVGVPSNTFNRNIEQRFLVAIEFENSINELDYTYIENLENNNVVRTGQDVSNNNELVQLHLIDTYRGYKEGDTFLFTPKNISAKKIKVNDLAEVEIKNPNFEEGKYYLGIYKNGEFECRLVDETSNQNIYNSLLELWIFNLSSAFESAENIIENRDNKNIEKRLLEKLKETDKRIEIEIEIIKNSRREYEINIFKVLVNLWNRNNALEYNIIDNIVNNRDENRIDNKIDREKNKIVSYIDAKIKGINDYMNSVLEQKIFNQGLGILNYLNSIQNKILIGEIK